MNTIKFVSYKMEIPIVCYYLTIELEEKREMEKY